METYTLPSFPLSYHTVHIALFHNVTNAAAIRQRLIQASTATGREGDRARAAVDYSFIEASMVSLHAFLDREAMAEPLRLSLGIISSAPSSPH